ncbi:MAG: response regulator, partial [Mucispirillum sp.]|nr:response regulator [Mucispirillum sp.]
MNKLRKKAKILIVDDDPLMRSLITAIFNHSDYSLSEAESGEQALEILPDIMPDIILLDIMMDGMDGFEVLQKIKENEEFRYIKIVLLSSKRDIHERLKGYSMGTDDYMVKPFFGKELLAKVNVLMRFKHTEEQNISMEEIIEQEIKKRMEHEEYIRTHENILSISNIIVAIAHHWKQPLTVVGAIVQDVYDSYINGELTEEYLKTSVDKSMRHIMFMSNIIDKFQQFINMSQQTIQKNVSFFKIFKEVLLAAKDIIDISGVTCIVNSVDYMKYITSSTVDYKMDTNPWALHQAMSIVILTANDFIVYKKTDPEYFDMKGMIRIKVYSEDDKAIIHVHHNGICLEEDETENIFTPYYILKNKDIGGGLNI